MTNTNTIVIVDEHPLFREGLKSIIRKEKRFKVVGEAGSVDSGISIIQNLCPDFVLADMTSSDNNGIKLVDHVKRHQTKTRVLIVSEHSGIDYIALAFQAGARAYILKESAHDKLLAGLDAVSKEEYFLDSAATEEVIKILMSQPVTRHKTISNSLFSELTPREQEILKLLAEGFKPKGIAEKLFISPKTVVNHRSNMMSKLGLHSFIELVRYAAKIGLIDVDAWK